MRAVDEGDVLLRVYKCVAGQQEEAKRRILATPQPSSVARSPAELWARIGTAFRTRPYIAVDDRKYKIDPDRIRAGQGRSLPVQRIQDSNLGRLSRRIYRGSATLHLLSR
jgi:hypothetical protein